MARHFNVQSLLWDRSSTTQHKRVRGILFDYIKSNTLSNVRLTSQIVDGICSGLGGLHSISIANGDIRASNILVQVDRIKWIDSIASITTPHIRISN